MKRIYLLLLLSVMFIQSGRAAWRPDEKLVEIRLSTQREISVLQQQKFIIDKIEANRAAVYVVPEELEQLRNLGYHPTVLIEDLQAYSEHIRTNPDYAAYHDYYSTLTLVDSLLNAFPGIIKKVSYGQSLQDRQLYAVKISDNVTVDENEPEISFDGCHHGDEIMGSEILIRLMRELCVKYGSDPQLTGLVNSREIWIYPFINPDGRQVPSRYNNAGVDVNRDWGYMWDAAGGSPGPFSQPESEAAGRWILDHQFVISQTDHGGTESISYPWSYRPDQCPDNDPIDFLAAGYSGSSGYANLAYYQGYSGMYAINGSAKDAFYGLTGAVGWTIEVSLDKQPPASQIPMYYNYNRPGMLYLIEQAGKGIQGVVTDAVTGEPVPAIIRPGDSSGDYWPVYSDPAVGDFHKFLLPGTYSLTVSANGYQTATVSSIQVSDTGAVSVPVQLQPETGCYAYRVIITRIPGNNFADECYTPASLGKPDNVNYSLGRDGYIVLDMGEEIADYPGADLQIIEGDTSPEGYEVAVSEDWSGPWYSLGTGSGTQEFDVSGSGAARFRYVRLQDDGDGSGAVADAGFDLDAVEGRLIPPAGPFVLANGYTVGDSASNGNGVLEAGETVDLPLRLQNLGVETAQNLRVIITGSDPLLTVLTDSVSCGDLTSGSQGMTPPFRISVDPATANNRVLELHLKILADGGYQWNHALQLPVRKGARIWTNYTELDFSDIFINVTREWPVQVKNTGSDSLYISSFECGLPNFWVTQAELAIAPGQQKDITVCFMPEDTAAYRDTLLISSSDPVNFAYQIPLAGKGIFAPDIRTAPDSLSPVLRPSDSLSVPVTVHNEGAGNLIFTAQIGSSQNGRGAGGSDSFGHVWIDSDESGGPQFDWIELASGSGTVIPITGLNSTSSEIPVGFEVPFYGNSFNTLRVCSNGWVSFTTFSVSYSNTALPSVLAPRNMIAPLWDNLNMQPDSRIYYLQEAHRFIIEWENMYTATGHGPYTFQMLIFDNGSFQFQYKALQNPENSYTVGMQNAAADDGFHIAFNEPYLHENLAVLINRRSWVSISPVGGQILPGNQQTLDVTFKTDNFPPGDFRASIEIHSNDPDESTVVIPVHMVVDSASTGLAGGSENIPAEFRLYQNYPNPFNPATRIAFDLAADEQVRLEIYDINGRKIRTLSDRRFRAGSHELEWDGKNATGRPAASGIYLYRLQAGDFRQSRKMILMK